MNWHALAAAAITGTAAAIVLTTLTLATYGAWHACRAVAAWTARTRAATAAAARTQPLGPVTWGTEPQPQPEPDLTDPRCGSDNDLLAQCRDMWRNSPEGEQ